VPTAAQVKALIRSHAAGDEERFYSVALQVAAQAARQGHGRFAQELRDVVDHARSLASTAVPEQRVRPVPMVQPRGELAGLLTAEYPNTRLTEMALGTDVKRRTGHAHAPCSTGGARACSRGWDKPPGSEATVLPLELSSAKTLVRS
jgi:hypothetical protein